MATKQPHLNGAYYGPSIPPPTKPHRRSPSPDLGCCFFSCFGYCLRSCSCCIVSLLCNILIGITVLLAITGLILYLIFRPNAVKFYVTDANLTEFNIDLKNNSNLHYNLNLDFTIRNPNQRVGIYYDEIKVDGFYGNQRFGSGDVLGFYQGQKNTTFVGTRIEGQNLVVLGDGVKEGFEEDVKSGVYRIDARLRLRVRFKFWVVKSWKVKPKIKCNGLKVPLVGGVNSTSGVKFETKECDFDFSWSK